MIIDLFHQPSIFLYLLDSIFIKKGMNYEKETRNHKKNEKKYHRCFL